ncbi:hypothetical protein LTR47_010646 [Exophiala xenobiotica]|nr:hypothetical protein LTR47_010646 [Exophiala xenobiotica]KAK5246929.1 hypothetical protein LTS06_007848 [Exophiala xenobiotica]KAK5345036.1 hypothetical protein LTR61_011218 [Exophiala xenobiotica]KAK5357798.1 hypothetical protein LTR11_011197 [Exophiala xenobiotica]KAK5358656.1 hypothetical protein LTS03_011201 [Exophiala xenobiotica]
MATVSDHPSESVAGEKNNATRQAHGLATPEQTPEPDTARLKEDEKRRQAESQAGTDKGQGGSTGSPPSSGGGTSVATDGNNGATQEQIDAVERVMKCSDGDYRQILGILDENPSTEDVMAAFKKLGCLTHEKYNKVNHATEAFHRVIDAAEHLGINDAAIAEMRNWDGVEDNLTLPANDTSSETAGEDADMRGSDQPTMPQLTDAHRHAFEVSWGLLQVLSDNPDDEKVINGLQEVNRKILEINAANGFPNSERFVIDFEVYQGVFKKALPLLEQWKQTSDEKARAELEMMNQWLEKFIKERGYPADWKINVPEAPTQSIPKPPVQSTASTATRTRSERLPKPLAFNEKDGYVLQGGVEKELYGYAKAGYGHRVLLRQDGQNGYDIFEFVRASKFGKNFVERNQNVLSGTEIKAGTKASLRGMSWKQVSIFGVAPVRTDFDDEAMLMAWVAFPQSEPTWYWRSYLGEEFGIDAVDEKLNTFRRKAGQLPRAVIDEDEAEESDDDEEGEDKATRLRYLREEMKRLEEGTARSRRSSSAKRSKPRRRAR